MNYLAGRFYVTRTPIIINEKKHHFFVLNMSHNFIFYLSKYDFNFYQNAWLLMSH